MVWAMGVEGKNDCQGAIDIVFNARSSGPKPYLAVRR